MCNSKYLIDMKKILLLICAVALWSCGKDPKAQKIDLSKVHAEIEVACIYEDGSDHTILFTGNVGGFTGAATIGVHCDRAPGTQFEDIIIAGESISFAFTKTFEIRNELSGKPATFTIKIDASNGQRVFESTAVLESI